MASPLTVDGEESKALREGMRVRVCVCAARMRRGRGEVEWFAFGSRGMGVQCRSKMCGVGEYLHRWRLIGMCVECRV